MALIGKPIGGGRLQDYIHVMVVAKELELNPTTIKRWLKENKVKNVTWGRDRRGWVYIHKNSVKALQQYRDSINPN